MHQSTRFNNADILRTDTLMLLYSGGRWPSEPVVPGLNKVYLPPVKGKILFLFKCSYFNGLC
jgi:hypothetical protein